MYVTYCRAQIASWAVVQVSAMKADRRCLLPQPLCTCRAAAFPCLWREVLIYALCFGPNRKQSPRSYESPTERKVWQLPVGELSFLVGFSALRCSDGIQAGGERWLRELRGGQPWIEIVKSESST